jgi:hypothetical protein
MTGLIVQLSYSKIAEKDPGISTLSECFFITKNIIACFSQSVCKENMRPVKPYKYYENFILIGTYIIPFSSESIYEYHDYNITLIVLDKSYDVEIPKMSILYGHKDSQVYIECFNNVLYQLDFKLSWAGKKLNILSHNLDQFYVKNKGKAGKTFNVYFADARFKGIDEKELMKGKKSIKVLYLTLEKKYECDMGSPVYDTKTNEFLGMIIRDDKNEDGKSYEYKAVSSVEFIKLMKKQGIIKKKPWYRFGF